MAGLRVASSVSGTRTASATLTLPCTSLAGVVTVAAVGGSGTVAICDGGDGGIAATTGLVSGAGADELPNRRPKNPGFLLSAGEGEDSAVAGAGASSAAAF